MFSEKRAQLAIHANPFVCNINIEEFTAALIDLVICKTKISLTLTFSFLSFFVVVVDRITLVDSRNPRPLTYWRIHMTSLHCCYFYFDDYACSLMQCCWVWVISYLLLCCTRCCNTNCTARTSKVELELQSHLRDLSCTSCWVITLHYMPVAL